MSIEKSQWLSVQLLDGSQAYLEQQTENLNYYKVFAFKEALSIIEKIVKSFSELFACFGAEKRWQQVYLPLGKVNTPVFFSFLTHQRVVQLKSITEKRLFQNRPGVVTYTFEGLPLHRNVPQRLTGPFSINASEL